MTSRHTDGPWRGEVNRRGQWEVFAPSQAMVCRLAKWAPTIDAADARLIAAAPELLAALKVAVETIRIWHGFGHPTNEAEVWALYQQSPEMRAITAAIAKAEGRS